MLRNDSRIFALDRYAKLTFPSSEFLSFATAQLEILPSSARGEGGSSLKSTLRTHKTSHWLLLFGRALSQIFLKQSFR